jgi:head-tail adaptor
MNTARLTEILVIKQLTTSASTEGIAVQYWRPVKTIAASITNQRGNLAFDSEYLGATYTDNVSFYCRFQRGLKKKETRIEWQCKDYEVINITTVQRNVATVIDCVGVK